MSEKNNQQDFHIYSEADETIDSYQKLVNEAGTEVTARQERLREIYRQHDFLMQELSKIQLDATQIDLADRDSWENYLMLLETEQDLILSEIGYLEDEAVKLDKWIGVFDFFREEADRRLQEIRDADLKRTAYLMEHKIKQSD